MAVAVLQMALIGPVAEDILFRGVMYGRFRASGYPVSGAFITAALFALCHNGTAVALIQIGVMGCALAWLYDRTESLWPPILLHSVNNLAVVLTFAALR